MNAIDLPRVGRRVRSIPLVFLLDRTPIEQVGQRVCHCQMLGPNLCLPIHIDLVAQRAGAPPERAG